MPATLAKLASKRATCHVAIDDDPEAITVEYSTRTLTPRLQEEINALIAESGDANDMRPVIRQFLALVTAWNLKADEAAKAPIALTEAALMEVPIEVLGAVLDTVTTDLDPKAKTATSSNGRSPAPPSTS